MQSRFFRVNLDCTIFSPHHLLRIFAHKRSVTVSKLSGYITRRKKIKNLNIGKRYKMVVTILGYALISSFISKPVPYRVKF